MLDDCSDVSEIAVVADAPPEGDASTVLSCGVVIGTGTAVVPSDPVEVLRL